MFRKKPLGKPWVKLDTTVAKICRGLVGPPPVPPNPLRGNTKRTLGPCLDREKEIVRGIVILGVGASVGAGVALGSQYSHRCPASVV